MTEINRVESVACESAVLVGVFLDGRTDHGRPLQELEGLAEAAGARVVGQLTQRRSAPDAATYLGKGKLVELKELIGASDADCIVFDNDLSPGQTRNLEEAVKTKVLDRTELILDIFANRARTYEARLAVELAQSGVLAAAAEAALDPPFPAAKRHRAARPRGKAVGERPPAGGAADQRVARRASRVHRRREREVATRRDFMTVSLVGYTNAGKSTLLNAADRRRRSHAKRLVFDPRHADPAMAIAGLGADSAERHGRIHSVGCRTTWSRVSRPRWRKPARLTFCCTWPMRAAPRSFEQISAAIRRALGNWPGIAGHSPGAQQDRSACRSRRRSTGCLQRYPSAIPLSARTGAGLSLSWRSR